MSNTVYWISEWNTECKNAKTKFKKKAFARPSISIYKQ